MISPKVSRFFHATYFLSPYSKTHSDTWHSQARPYSYFSFFSSPSALSRVHPLMLWMLSFKSKPRHHQPWRSARAHPKTLGYRPLLRWTFFSMPFWAFPTPLPSVSTSPSRGFSTPCHLTWISLASSIALLKWATSCSRLANALLGNELPSITQSFGLFLLTSPSKYVCLWFFFRCRNIWNCFNCAAAWNCIGFIGFGNECSCSWILDLEYFNIWFSLFDFVVSNVKCA